MLLLPNMKFINLISVCILYNVIGSNGSPTKNNFISKKYVSYSDILPADIKNIHENQNVHHNNINPTPLTYTPQKEKKYVPYSDILPADIKNNNGNQNINHDSSSSTQSAFTPQKGKKKYVQYDDLLQ